MLQSHVVVRDAARREPFGVFRFAATPVIEDAVDAARRVVVE